MAEKTVTGYRFILLLLLLLAAVGCNDTAVEKRVKVTGKVTKDGQPLVVDGEEAGLGYVQIAFYRVDEQGNQTTDPESARIAKDGAYELTGADGRGIAPGTYTVVIRQWDPYPTDRLEGKFDEQNSPMRHTVAEDTVIDIDLADIERKVTRN